MKSDDAGDDRYCSDTEQSIEIKGIERFDISEDVEIDNDDLPVIDSMHGISSQNIPPEHRWIFAELPRLRKRALRCLRSDAQAHDTVQNACKKFFANGKYDAIPDHEKVLVLHRIVNNAIIDLHREHTREQKYVSSGVYNEATTGMQDQQNDPDSHASDNNKGCSYPIARQSGLSHEAVIPRARFEAITREVSEKLGEDRNLSS